MNFKKKVLFAKIASVLCILVLCLTSLDMLSFQTSFYEYEFKQLNTSQRIGMSEADLTESIDVLLTYIRGDENDLNIEFEVEGEVRAIYSDDEISHMKDVKNLYESAMIVRNGSCIGLLFLFIILLVDNRKEIVEVCTYAYIRVYTAFLFLLSALLLYATIDFTAVWTMFHKLLFTNDLWLMDANTSLMIQMLEEKVFFDLVFMVLGVFAFISLSIYMYSFYYQRKLLKRGALDEIN